MVGVAVGTTALVVVLSVFNGLEDLIRSLYNTFDPDLQISLVEGKSFEYTDSLKQKMEGVEGISSVIEVIEDNVLVRYNDGEAIVRMKGVSNEFVEEAKLVNHIVNGEMKLTEGDLNYAIVGRGIRYGLSINPKNDFLALQFYYPKNINPGVTNPSSMYNSGVLMPAGIFAIEKQYDEKYIYVPIRFARKLLNYGKKVTALELELEDEKQLAAIQEQIQETLGSGFRVLNSDEQHVGLLKAIKIEKLFLYLTFSFILAVASFNIFFSLTMLALDKKADISILYAMGARRKLIRNIFLTEGAIISLGGATVGAVIGFAICFLQQQYGLISMGMATSVQDAYPIKMIPTDFLFTALSIVVITCLASFKPASIAAKSVELQRL